MKIWKIDREILKIKELIGIKDKETKLFIKTKEMDENLWKMFIYEKKRV